MQVIVTNAWPMKPLREELSSMFPSVEQLRRDSMVLVLNACSEDEAAEIRYFVRTKGFVCQ